jgi:uncharacterized phage protein gp47/JayE
MQERIQADYATRGEVVDFERDVVMSLLLATVSDQLGKLSEITQALYDAFDVNNATGLQLSNLGLIVGVERRAATNSTVILTVTGTVGVTIPSNSVVQGGENSSTRWLIDGNTTIPAGGSTTTTATAEDLGALAADPGTITQIATPVTGWDTVTNAASAVVGLDLETDAEFRLRRQQSLQISGGGSANSIRANIVSIPDVTAAVVIDNPDNVVAVVRGETMEPNSMLAVVHPPTISTAIQQQVAEKIYERLCTGIETNGTDVVASVTDLAGGTKTIKFDLSTTRVTDVAVTVTLDVGFSLATVSGLIEDAITAHYAALSVGQTVFLLDLTCIIGATQGVIGITALTIDGAAVDFVPTVRELPIIGTITVT